MNINPVITTYKAYIGDIVIKGLTKEQLLDVLSERFYDFFIFDVDFDEYGGKINVYENEKEAKDDCGYGFKAIATVYEEEKL